MISYNKQGYNNNINYNNKNNNVNNNYYFSKSGHTRFQAWSPTNQTELDLTKP